ncbi:MAG TPA: hypothetical protein VNM92_04495 [Thermoanaerobaculia bacterium]|nr:hypothetical protein [Thermoanaerobaculia bacterium]
MNKWLAPLLCVALTNCALTSHGTQKTLNVTSQPAAAQAVLKCDGKDVGATTTPGTITFHRKHRACELRVTSEGFEEHRVSLERGPARAFWGNFGLAGGALFGILEAERDNNLAGLIAIPISLVVGGGAMLVDRLTGAYYEWWPAIVDARLITPTAVSAPPPVPARITRVAP